jgi:hypothetical protein
MSTGRISVHIGGLVLHGVDPLVQHSLVEGLKTELARVLAEPAMRDAITSSRSTPVLRLGRLPTQPGAAGARALGAGLGKAIAKEMNR